jgi:hypothetical protein
MTKKSLASKFALGTFLMIGMASVLPAQSTSGTLRGTVLDPSGALIPQAQLTISSANGFARTIKSDSTGSFELANLAPGSYSVSVDAAGFTPALEGIRVATSKVTTENVTLGISVNQEIEVSANDAPAADNAVASGDSR